MNTNGIVGGPWFGTLIVDIWAGLQSYALLPESAGGFTKGRYTVPLSLDEAAGWVASNPPNVNIIAEGASWPTYQAAIIAGTPTILSFSSWVLGPPVVNGGIEYYYNWGTPGTGNSGGQTEVWNSDDGGHAVTGVGFHPGFDPDLGGPAPFADWYITRDNWMSTGVDVAVPVNSGNWMCTFFVGEPVEIAEPTGEVSPKIQEIDFSIDTDNGPPFGLLGTDVNTESLVPGDWAQDDFYLWPDLLTTNNLTMDENIPGVAGQMPGNFTPALNLGTGNAENTDGYCFGWGDYTGGLGGVSETLDGQVASGFLRVQFTVNPDSQGLAASAVAAQAPLEEGGDVFESAMGGTNSLLADEGILGLEDSPENDINSLVVPDAHLGGLTPPFAALPLTVDTDGDGLFDAPTIFFSIKNGGSFGQVGADVFMTAPFSPPGLPVLNLAWATIELGLSPGGADELDALYVERPAEPGTPVLGPFVYFSLARGSISLQAGSNIQNVFNGSGSGADPGDIIGVVPAGPAGGAAGQPPVVGPMVVITATTLGLQADMNPATDATDDDLNGLHMTAEQLQVRNWELF